MGFRKATVFMAVKWYSDMNFVKIGKMGLKSILVAVLLVSICTKRTFSHEGPSPLIAAVKIDVFGAPKKEAAVFIDLATHLILLKKGDAFTPQKLNQSIDGLKQSNLFQSIHADVKEEDHALILMFQLTPFGRLKKIRVSGAAPLFEKEILDAMSIKTGDVFNAGQLPKQEERIRERIRSQGFIQPKVSVMAQKDPKDGHYRLHVTVENGQYFRITRFKIDGNRFIAANIIKMRMKTWLVSQIPGASGRFIERDLKQDVKNLRAYYRFKGYADAAIVYQVEKRPETQTVQVRLSIDEGRRYQAVFKGHRAFSAYTLQKDLVWFLQGNKKDRGIKATLKKIKERYRRAGYLKARVEVKAQDPQQAESRRRVIFFIIDEGPQSIVESIRITGHRLFDRKKIEKQMLTRLPSVMAKGMFVPAILDDDLKAIGALYASWGYHQAKISKQVVFSPDFKKVAIEVAITEGVQTVVTSIDLVFGSIVGRGLLTESEMSEKMVQKVGDPFSQKKMDADLTTLTALVAEKGYPHTRVTGKVHISPDQSRADIVYRVDEGPGAVMGQVYFQGNFRTQDRVLRNELKMQPGDPFTLKKLLETQKNIRNLSCIDDIRFKSIGLTEKMETVHLIGQVNERKPFFVEAGAGYDSERKFYFHTQAGDRNLLGTNKTARLNLEVSEIGYGGEANLIEPRLFGSRISAATNGYAERRKEQNQDFGIQKAGLSLKLARKWTDYLNASLGVSFEQREQFRSDLAEWVLSEAYDPGELAPRQIFTATPALIYDTRDNFIRPRQGIYSSLSADFSRGLEDSLDNFIRYRFDGSLYLSPFTALTFVLHGRAGHIAYYDSSQEVPEDQLFFLGGVSDVRGYKENLFRFDKIGGAVGGKSVLVGNLEARLDLGANVELTLFYDIGRLTDTESIDEDDTFRSTAGLGLRYITPVGPIGFLYGFKLDARPTESPGRLYFSIGYTF
jgi:outer membrane protein insertion porin family